VNQRKKVLRTVAHLLMWSLVAWGIYRAGVKSAAQLEAQRTELNQRAEDLEKQADSAQADEAQSLREQASELRGQVDDFWKADWKYLFLAGLVYAVAMFFSGSYWFVCLNAMGQHAPWRIVAWAYFYGNLGKYVPGKAMVVLLRLAILSPYGIRKVATTLTIFMETLSSMAVGGAFAAICVIFLDLDWRINVMAIGLLLATVIPTAPVLLRFVLTRLQPGVENATLEEWTGRLNWRLTFRGWALLCITWLGFGLSLGCVLYGLPSNQWLAESATHFWLSVFAACGLSIVIGFLSMVPGGAGVREVVLAMILTPVVGATAALCCAIWLRITWLITELILAGICFVLEKQVPEVLENETI
jgi:glycosyltransferase 2 family protein